MTPKSPEQFESIREETRGLILGAAFELFARNGFNNTSIRQIAEKAGISKGLIYHYFNSKEELLEAIFVSIIEETEHLMEVDEDEPPEDQLRAILENTFLFLKEHREFSRLIISLGLQEEAVASLKPQIKQVKTAQLKTVIGIFEKLGYDDPETEAYYLDLQLDGATLGYLVLGEDYPLETIKNKIIDTYVHH